MPRIFFFINTLFNCTGFDHLSLWAECGGEVFQIYAHGKNMGDPIEDRDTVMFYYPVVESYVCFVKGRQVTIDKCTRVRPPDDGSFNKCINNLVEVAL